MSSTKPSAGQRVVLITGASSGIGQTCAAGLAREGYHIYGTFRSLPATDCPFTPLLMDVTSDESVHRAVGQVLAEQGRLDAVINNAGFALAGPVEGVSLAEVRMQLETNLLGPWRVCQATIGALREQRGYIINIGSLGGRVGMPFQSAYCASKFALAGFTESLSMEVRRQGIKVVLIEPGNFATHMTAKRRKVIPSDSPYQESFERVIATQEQAEARGADPAGVLRVVSRVLRSRNPRPRYSVGKRFERFGVAIKGVLPGRLFERLLMSFNGM
jgi:NAD(P)-dependent dehydrogenase (short-subunit alcohol dehydrogenase family)